MFRCNLLHSVSKLIFKQKFSQTERITLVTCGDYGILARRALARVMLGLHRFEVCPTPWALANPYE